MVGGVDCECGQQRGREARVRDDDGGAAHAQLRAQLRRRGVRVEVGDHAAGSRAREVHGRRVGAVREEDADDDAVG